MEKLLWVILAIYLLFSAASLITSWILYSLRLVLLVYPLLFTILFIASSVLTASLKRCLSKTENRVADFEKQEAKIRKISRPYWKFTEQELIEATDNFSERRVIGKGRFGTVYLGIPRKGGAVAIKRMESSEDNECCLKHFLQEVQILGQLRHRNVLRILGYFYNGKEMIIVSKFMLNHSLDVLLHGAIECRLDWKQRLNIAVGVARGMSYLHHELKNTVIVHHDLKPANILVDEHMEAHIADFGLARVVTNNQLAPNSLASCFSVGYTAPERRYQMRPSPKEDVYSFGVVLLELVSRVRPTSSSLVEKGLTLPQWAHKVAAENNMMEFIDDCLKSTYNEEHVYQEIEKVLRLGIICTREDSKLRPDMTDVVKIIVSIKEGIREFNIPISILINQKFQCYETFPDSSMSS